VHIDHAVIHAARGSLILRSVFKSGHRQTTRRGPLCAKSRLSLFDCYGILEMATLTRLSHAMLARVSKVMEHRLALMRCRCADVIRYN